IPNWLPDNIMGDLDVLVQMDDRLEFHEVDPDDGDGDSNRGGSIIRIDPATGRQLRLKPPTPKAQVGGSSHDTPVQPQTFKYTLQQTDLMPKLRSMGFKFSGNQIVLSKQQRDQLVQKLGDKFQSIFGKAEKFTEGVAGPKNCWPGHRKVGTKPGTGKNAGKRVNDCEKIKETDVDESGLQYYTGVKKHGEKYMKMAAAAGRRGASQAELGRLKDRYSKAYKKEDAYMESLWNQLQEKAPPGDKYERMVKHIKTGYSKDGKLTDVEKSKAYGAAWKAKNKEKK
ncbi:MAG: hypothetical protein EBU90_16185, partial [Proteobacteria bacterium]|nr:hypothetical protein [Pseudomonadota bacterium]